MTPMVGEDGRHAPRRTTAHRMAENTLFPDGEAEKFNDRGIGGKVLETFRRARQASVQSIMFGAPWICRRCINTCLKPGRRRLIRFSSTGKGK